MLYVYRRNPSTGARDLADALQGRRFRARQQPITQVLRPNDVVVCWGEALPPINGVRILNGGAIRTKRNDAAVLAATGVPTIEIRDTRPEPRIEPAIDPALAHFTRAQELATEFAELPPLNGRPAPIRDGLRDMIAAFNALNAMLQTPVPQGRPVDDGEWLPRTNDHVGGDDLLDPDPNEADFWVRKMEFVQEYRIHSFLGRSIRAGRKAAREGFEGTSRLHPWIRSWDGGWRILYDGVSANNSQRNLAHQAVQALGLDFGAVDIGEKADGSLVVLEVNRAPGLDGGTIDKYAEAIRNWVAGTWAEFRPIENRPARQARRRAA